MRIGAALALAALAAASVAVQAAPEEYTIDRGHTFPSFEVLHLGIATQRGRFDKTSGRIVIDREAGTGVFEIAIDTRSISTGNAFLDTALRGEDFFHVEKYPALTFKSRRVEYEKGVPRRAVGDLTMLAQTLPLTLDITRFGCTRLPLMVRTTCGADVEAVVSRKAFGMGSYPLFIGDDVRIEIQIEAWKLETSEPPPLPGG